MRTAALLFILSIGACLSARAASPLRIGAPPELTPGALSELTQGLAQLGIAAETSPLPPSNSELSIASSESLAETEQVLLGCLHAKRRHLCKESELQTRLEALSRSGAHPVPWTLFHLWKALTSPSDLHGRAFVALIGDASPPREVAEKFTTSDVKRLARLRKEARRSATVRLPASVSQWPLSCRIAQEGQENLSFSMTDPIPIHMLERCPGAFRAWTQTPEKSSNNVEEKEWNTPQEIDSRIERILEETRLDGLLVFGPRRGPEVQGTLYLHRLRVPVSSEKSAHFSKPVESLLSLPVSFSKESVTVPKPERAVTSPPPPESQAPQTPQSNCWSGTTVLASRGAGLDLGWRGGGAAWLPGVTLACGRSSFEAGSDLGYGPIQSLNSSQWHGHSRMEGVWAAPFALWGHKTSRGNLHAFTRGGVFVLVSKSRQVKPLSFVHLGVGVEFRQTFPAGLSMSETLGAHLLLAPHEQMVGAQIGVRIPLE